MIKFFRKIRYNLMETGKTAKYFKYAIGEIILVVIGILLALQINTWNNNKQEAKLEQQYINRLITELKEDAIYYNKKSNQFAEISNAIFNVQQFWLNDNLIIEDSLKFWDDFRTASGSGPWYKQPVIWTQLVQSGELKLLKNQFLIESLFKHYAEVKSVADNFNEYPTQTTNDARKVVANSLADSDYMLTPYNKRNRIPPKLWYEKIRLNKKEYQAVFLREGIIAGLHISHMKTLATSAEETVILLEKNLETND